jgi:hypothetical protein
MVPNPAAWQSAWQCWEKFLVFSFKFSIETRISRVGTDLIGEILKLKSQANAKLEEKPLVNP